MNKETMIENFGTLLSRRVIRKLRKDYTPDMPLLAD